MEDRLTFLELKVYDRLGGSSSKRSTVYQEFTLLDMYFGSAMVRLSNSNFSKHGALAVGLIRIEKPFAKSKIHRSLHNN